MVSFTPSAIEDEVYNIYEQIDYLVSSKEYTKDALRAVEEYFENLEHEDPLFQWNEIVDPYPDNSDASVSFAWIENRHLHHICLNFQGGF